MAFAEKELRTKLARGEDLPSIGRWFVEKIAAENPRDCDLSPFEIAFWEEVKAAFGRWLQRQIKH